MSADRDEVLGRLAEELAAAAPPIDDAAWAARFAVEIADVVACRRALAALELCLGEDVVATPVADAAAPALPEVYELEREIGRGGMGVVWRARHRELDRHVAIKVVRPGTFAGPAALQRFRAEARTLARLRHPGIVAIFDVGETADGLLWYAMDLIEGQTLAAEIAQRGRLLPTRAAHVLQQVAAAVAHAHEHGVVHRDLKPQNVLIDAAGRAFVVDFGLARDASVGTQTLSGELLGTPAYMSPEQVAGDTGAIGEATDIWGLGALLYECLAGTSPFGGRPLHATMRAILADEPRDLREFDRRIPPPLVAICGMALQKRPQARYASARAFGDDVARAMAGEPVQAKLQTPLQRTLRVVWARRRLLLQWTVAALLAIALMVWFVVPSWLLDLRLQNARALRGAGHAAAAAMTLREAWQGSVPSARRNEVAVELVGCLIDAAAERQLARDPVGAAALGDEAVALLRERSMRARGEDESAWRWQRARIAAVARYGDSARPALEPLLADLRSSLPSVRHVAARLAALHTDVGAQLPEDLRAAVLRERLLALATDASTSWPAQFPVQWTGAELVGWQGRTVEGMLLGLAADTNVVLRARAAALRAFLLLRGLPVYEVFDDDHLPQPGALAAAVDTLRTLWTELPTLSPAQELQRHLDLLARGLDGDVFAQGADAGYRYEQAFRRWTGHRPTLNSVAEARQWWASVREQGSEERLCRELGVSRGLPIAAILDRALAADEELVMAWHQLGKLRLPPGAVVPECMPPLGSAVSAWLLAWQRAAGIAAEHGLVVRSALLGVFDGGAPEVLATQRFDAAPGSRVEFEIGPALLPAPLLRVEWAKDAERDLALPTGPRWFGRHGHTRGIFSGVIGIGTAAELRKDWANVTADLAGTWERGSRSRGGRYAHGEISVVECRYATHDHERRVLCVLLLVHVGVAGDTAVDWVKGWSRLSAEDRAFWLGPARGGVAEVHAVVTSPDPAAALVGGNRWVEDLRAGPAATLLAEERIVAAMPAELLATVTRRARFVSWPGWLELLGLLALTVGLAGGAVWRLRSRSWRASGLLLLSLAMWMFSSVEIAGYEVAPGWLLMLPFSILVVALGPRGKGRWITLAIVVAGLVDWWVGRASGYADVSKFAVIALWIAVAWLQMGLQAEADRRRLAERVAARRSR